MVYHVGENQKNRQFLKFAKNFFSKPFVTRYLKKNNPEFFLHSPKFVLNFTKIYKKSSLHQLEKKKQKKKQENGSKNVGVMFKTWYIRARQMVRKQFANQMRGNVDGTANMHCAAAATERKQRAANRSWSVFPANTTGFYHLCGRNFAVKVCSQTARSNSPTFSFHSGNFFS